MSIVEFLTARLDEDEAAARACVIPASDGYKPHPDLSEWFYEPDGEVQRVQTPEMLVSPYPEPWFVTMDNEGLSASVDRPEGRHIARFDPARVLAEVKAKRRIVGHHESNPIGSAQGPFCQVCDTAGGEWPCITLGALASIYAGHPDYDDRWQA